jgi:hypothetical protein
MSSGSDTLCRCPQTEVLVMIRVLLVANKTLGSGEVSEFVRSRMEGEECHFTLLVPATPHSHREPATVPDVREGVAPSHAVEDDYEHARSRLEYGIGLLRGLGAAVDGDVGDPNPAKAISDVLTRRQFDEVALSTLPKGVSRWLRQDIPHKVERKFNIPVKIIKTQ